MTNNESELTTADKVIPDDLLALIQQPDGAARLLQILPERYPPTALAESTLKQGPASAHKVWETCGCVYKLHNRLHEAIAILEELYEQLVSYQLSTGKHAHKCAPLVWLSECHTTLDHPWLARRYLMLAACDDAILHKGRLDSFVKGGLYSRAVWQHGFPHRLLERYLRDIWALFQRDSNDSAFPERVIQQLDQDWLTEYPTPHETGEYRISRQYLGKLVGGLGSGTGKELELIAHYLLSSTPGCRAYMRQRTFSTDLDVAGAFEGPVQDFRSDLGRYFVCECKDWENPADITAFAKFSRILDSAKCRFGILFSRDGISGAGRTLNAEREQLKLFQDRGIVIVVVDKKDLETVTNGANFITVLRTKYEQVRLDLRGKSADAQAG